MAATYRSSTTTNTGAGTASSISLNVPAGSVANDVLFACITVGGGTGATITPPSGWTAIGSGVSQGTNIQTKVYWRQATGYETASYSWTFDSARQAAAIMIDYSGAYTFPPTGAGTSSTATAATTTTTASASSSYETGLALQFFGMFNSTAATTATAGGSYTQRADTCTTASSFIETAVQDVSKGLFMGGMPAAAATISGAATSTAIIVFLEDARPAFNVLAEDEFVNGAATTVTSTGFTLPVNMPNELVLVFVNVMVGTATVSSISGGGLTWVNVARANTNAGSTEVWRAFNATPQTIGGTINFSASATSVNFMAVGIVGADMTGTSGSGAIGATATAASSSAAPTVSLTTTRNNSWVWGAGNNPSAAGNPTAGANQTVLRIKTDGTNVCTGWAQRQNALTAASGTSVTINDTSPSTNSCNILAVEILPAIYHNLGASGVG